MRNFMRHYAGQLRLVVCRKDQTGIYIEKPSGQRNGINFLGVYDLYPERHLRIGVSDQILSQAIDVVRDFRVRDQFSGRLNAVRILFAESDLGLETVPIANPAGAPYVPDSYRVDVPS